MLRLFSVCVLAVALSGLAEARERVEATVAVDVHYLLEGYGAQDGRHAAQGVRVSAFTRTFFGIPRVQASAVSDADGRVELRVRVTRGERLRLRVETEGELAKTFPGRLNVFLRPHRETTSLSEEASFRARIDHSVLLTGVRGRAAMVQDTGTRAGAWARSQLGSVLPRLTTVSYSYPGWLTPTGTSYTPWDRRVVIADDVYNSHPETVLHETAHTLWYQARGKRTELYWPLRHSLTERAGNPALALSEGFANVFAAYLGDVIARARGLPALEDHSMERWSAETHHSAGVSAQQWLAWGEDNELNVMCALWDLQDDVADPGWIALGEDRTNGGPLPSGASAFRLIVDGVVRTRAERRLSFSELFTQALEPVYGLAGREVLAINGVELR